MPLNVPPQLVNDYLMSKSVMDQPRSGAQRVIDLMFGRTLPEQATNAFTGGLGTIKTSSEFLPYLKGALDLLPLRVRALLERSPKIVEIRRPIHEAEKMHAALAPASFWGSPEGGLIVVEPEGILNKLFGFGHRVGKEGGLTEAQLIEAAIAHELGHAGNKFAFGNAGAVFPGARFLENPVTEDAQRGLREVFPVMSEGGRFTSGWPYPDYYREIDFTNIGEALKGLEGFYSNEVNNVAQLPPLPTPPLARQVNRYAMRQTAEAHPNVSVSRLRPNLPEILSSMGPRPDLGSSEVLRNAEWLRRYGLVK